MIDLLTPIAAVTAVNAGIVGVGAAGLNAENKKAPSDASLRSTIDQLQREIEILKKAKDICEAKKVATSEPAVADEPTPSVSDESVPVQPADEFLNKAERIFQEADSREKELAEIENVIAQRLNESEADKSAEGRLVFSRLNKALTTAKQAKQRVVTARNKFKDTRDSYKKNVDEARSTLRKPRIPFLAKEVDSEEKEAAEKTLLYPPIDVQEKMIYELNYLNDLNLRLKRFIDGKDQLPPTVSTDAPAITSQEATVEYNPLFAPPPVSETPAPVPVTPASPVTLPPFMFRTNVFKDGSPAPPPLVAPGQFIEAQQGAGCGRHALNNFLGGVNFVNDKPTKIKSINDLITPVNLQTLCGYLKEKIEGFEDDYCPADENYDILVLDAGLRLFGFEQDADFSNTRPTESEDTAGFLVHIPSPKHWYVLKKEGIGYVLLDSIGSRRVGPMPLDQIYADYVAKEGADKIFRIKRTGITTDRATIFRTDIGREGEIDAELEARVKAWYTSVQGNVKNNEILAEDVNRYFEQYPGDNLDSVKNVIGKLSGMNVFVPKGYTPPSPPAPQETQTQQTERQSRRNKFEPTLSSSATPEQQKKYEQEKKENARWYTLSIKKKRTPEEEKEFEKLNANRSTRGGNRLRKKKLRTRRATKQKNVRRTRSR